jgi:hypothetical protein
MRSHAGEAHFYKQPVNQDLGLPAFPVIHCWRNRSIALRR